MVSFFYRICIQNSCQWKFHCKVWRGVSHVIWKLRTTFVTVAFPEVFSKTSLEKMESCFGKPEWWACRNFDAGLYHGSRRNKRQLKQRSSQIRARIMQYGFASWGDIRVASFALTGDAGSVCSYGQSVKSSSNLLKSRGWRAGQPGL